MLKTGSAKTNIVQNNKSNNDTENDSEEMIGSCIFKCPAIQCDNETFTFQDRILHHKCPVIKLVKHQMVNADNVLTESIETLKKLFWFKKKL